MYGNMYGNMYRIMYRGEWYRIGIICVSIVIHHEGMGLGKGRGRGRHWKNNRREKRQKPPLRESSVSE